MKTIPEQTQEVILISEAKIAEIKAIINTEWDTFYTEEQLARHIEQGYIFGIYSNNEHYQIDFIMGLIKEVYLEKNPPAPIPDPEPLPDNQL